MYRAHSVVVSDLRSETKGSRTSLAATYVPICRGESSGVIARLMPKCL